MNKKGGEEMTINERMKQARESAGVSLSDLSALTGIAKSTLQRYETGNTKKIPIDAISIIEKILNLSTGYLMGWETNSTLDSSINAPNITEDYTTFPVIGEVAAGYEHPAIEDWDGDTVEIPNSYLIGRKKEDFFVLRVKGDSMYPLYHEGDKVLILKQSTMNYSGQVGVVLYDDDKGTLKKVEYSQGEDWMRLVPINPNHPIVKIENESLEHCRILGIPRLLIREIGD